MPKSFYKLSLLILFFIIYENCHGQEYLVFDKPGLVKRVRFYPNDNLVFKANNSRSFIKDRIVDFNDNTILFENTLAINVDSIQYIRVKSNTTFSKFRSVLSSVMITGGAGYLIIDSFNNGINNSDILDQKSINASAILVIAGFIIKPWKHRKHKIRNNKRLYIINMDKGLDL
ncbi:hypothetical protein HZR84_06075 [Hyphobacterium sp. CCMP332]|nr:hypothetical protein HZR84_06075 [Hyphobacterium sp. CCMP332]